MSRESRRLWTCLARGLPFHLCNFHLLPTKLSCQNIQSTSVSCLDQLLAALIAISLCKTSMCQAVATGSRIELLFSPTMAARHPTPQAALPCSWGTRGHSSAGKSAAPPEGGWTPSPCHMKASRKIWEVLAAAPHEHHSRGPGLQGAVKALWRAVMGSL